LTLFLPGRFSETEVKSEAIYTALNLMTLYHDSIMDRSRGFTTCDYLLVTGERSGAQRLKNLLTFLHYTETLIEMLSARYFGASGTYIGRREGKWIIVAIVELIKACCRLRLLSINGGRMLVSPTPDEARLLRDRRAGEHVLSQISTLSDLDKPKSMDIMQMYAKHGRSPQNPHGNFVPHPQHPRDTEAFIPSHREILGEVLFFIRPVVYVVGRVLCKEDSWRPFLLSLFVDIASKQCLAKFTDMSPSQRSEAARRLFLYAYYLVRDPFFHRFTSVPLLAFGRFLRSLPVFGALFGGVIELLLALQGHHFYTSAS